MLGYEKMSSQELCLMEYAGAPEYLLPAHGWDKSPEAAYQPYAPRHLESPPEVMSYNGEGLLTATPRCILQFLLISAKVRSRFVTIQ